MDDRLFCDNSSILLLQHVNIILLYSNEDKS
jgi:hypothetical protein